MDNRSHFRSLDELIRGLDRERALERTTSTGDMDKFQEAICAFANDLPNSCKKGYLILRDYENGGKTGGDVPSMSQALSQVLSQDEEKDASIDAKDATSSSKVETLDEKAASLADNRRNSAIRKQRQELYKEPH